MSTVAIIGASSNRGKYGNIAVRAYREKGWTVYPVNPRDDEIEGIKTYKSIGDVPLPLDRISIYLPPPLTLKALDAIAAANAADVYFNPGTHTPEALQRAEELGINAVAACSIVAIGVSPAQFM